MLSVKSEMKFCAVISLYNPNILELNKLLAVACDVLDFVYLIDNSDGYVEYGEFGFDNVVLIRQVNSGITGAMNRGITESAFIYDYYLFLDQDSFFERSNLIAYLNVIALNNMAISGPVSINDFGESIHSKFFDSFDEGGDSDFIVLNRTQLSGLCVSKACLLDVGLFDERYFLNLGDTEWCLRAQRKGYSIVIHKNIHMCHQYAEGRKRFLFYEFFISEPFRLYYCSRDSLRLMFSPSPIGVKFKLTLKLFFTFFEIMITDRSVERFKYFIRGFYSFLIGEIGRMK